MDKFKFEFVTPEKLLFSSEVEQAYKSPASDELYISQLKKEKLRLKEEISRLSR